MTLLKKLQQATAAGGGRNKQYNAFGAILQVASAEKLPDETLKLTGTLANANPAVSVDEVVTVTFRGDNATKAVTNFVKGNGKGALKTKDATKGTFLILEGVYVTDEKDESRRVLSARWLNTLASVDDPEHANRSFLEGVLASAPRITFQNPTPAAGEPESITLSVNAKVATGRVRNEHGTFPKEFPLEWAVSKLQELPAGKRVSVSIDTIEYDKAQAAANRGELDTRLGSALGQGTMALAMLRVTDGEEVVTRAVYVPFKNVGDEYVPDVERALEELHKNNIFKGIPNEALFQGLEAGDLKLEVIPGYRMKYAGDPTKDDNAAYKLIQDVKRGATQRYEMIFGNDTNRFAKVLLPGIARDDTVAGFSPFNVLADTPGTYLANEFATSIIDPKAAPAAPVRPLEEADPAEGLDDSAREFDAAAAEEPEASGPRP